MQDRYLLETTAAERRPAKMKTLSPMSTHYTTSGRNIYLSPSRLPLSFFSHSLNSFNLNYSSLTSYVGYFVNSFYPVFHFLEFSTKITLKSFVEAAWLSPLIKQYRIELDTKGITTLNETLVFYGVSSLVTT